MKTCPVCQKLVNDETKFCYYCGASLMNLAPESPAAEEPVPEEQPAEEPAEQTPEQPVAEIVEPEPVVESEPVAIPEPEPVVEPEPIAIPEPEPVAEPEPIAAPEPIVIPAPIKEPEPIKEPVKDVPPVSEKKEVVVNATDSRSLMTTAGYIFSTILFHIPLIGLIFLFVWGCGRPKNISLKRYSLAWLIMRLLGIIIVLSFAVFVLICFSDKFPILTDAFVKFFS